VGSLDGGIRFQKSRIRFWASGSVSAAKDPFPGKSEPLRWRFLGGSGRIRIRNADPWILRLEVEDLVTQVLGHLINYFSLINIIDCLTNTPHTRTINLLYLIYLNLSLDLVNQATKIGGCRLALACYRIP
jgi:hypothetical protein